MCRKIILIIIMLLGTISIASADWSLSCSLKITPNQNTTCGSLSITNVQFSAPVTGHLDINRNLILDEPVFPEVYFVLSGTSVALDEGQVYEDDNGIRVTATGLPASNSILWEYEHYNPSVFLKIETWVVSLPALQVWLVPEYGSVEYQKNAQTSVAINVKNIGDIPVSDITVGYDFGDLNPMKATYHIEALGKNDIGTIYVSFAVLKIYGSHPLKATASMDSKITYLNGTTVINQIYFSGTSSLQITKASATNPKIELTKSIGTRIYQCKKVGIIITIYNNGISDMENVSITDTVPDYLIFKNISYQWKVPRIKAGEQQLFIESLMPNEVGVHSIGAAIASYTVNKQAYSSISNTVDVNIIGTDKSCKPEQSIVAAIVTITATPIKTTAKVNAIATPRKMTSSATPIVKVTSNLTPIKVENKQTFVQQSDNPPTPTPKIIKRTSIKIESTVTATPTATAIKNTSISQGIGVIALLFAYIIKKLV